MNPEHDGFNPATRRGCKIGGRTIFQAGRVDLAPDTFTLKPSTGSGQGK